MIGRLYILRKQQVTACFCDDVMIFSCCDDQPAQRNAHLQLLLHLPVELVLPCASSEVEAHGCSVALGHQ